MKRFLLLALVCPLFVTPLFGQSKKIVEGNVKCMDTMSYCVGIDVGQTVKHQFEGQNIDIEELKNGLKGAFTNKSDISNDDANAMLEKFFGTVVAERQVAFRNEREKSPTAVFKMFANADENKKIAYAIGVATGTNINNQSFSVHYYWLLKGVDDAYNGGVLLNPEQINGFMNNYYQVVLPVENKKRSEGWLAEKAKESGVVKSESGLLYRVDRTGDMERAAKNDGDTVVVHYEGRLRNGKVFDSSRKRNEPMEFQLNMVIKGFAEGMKYVGPGGKITLYIPSELAYGTEGAGGVIGPNEALEFEVELIDVKPVDAKANSTADGKTTTR